MFRSRLQSVAIAGVVFACAAHPGARMSSSQIAAPVGDHPTAVISNGLLRATVFLPDAERGFYRSTRFDWSGVVAPVEFGAHRFYVPWFTRSEPGVRDFVYRDVDIVAGAESSVLGPAEEFPVPQGFERAAPGGTFIKVGVGVLRRPDAESYSPFGHYEIVDSGTWEVETSADAVTFVQVIADPASGYGYEYRKTVALRAGAPDLVISHHLRNTGRLPIETTQYNHNFLTMRGATTGPAFRIQLPFAIQTSRPPDPELAVIAGNTITYTRPLVDRERVSFPIEGFGPSASDYDVRVENIEARAGVRVRADRPMVRAMLWSIRSVISFEPFVDVSTAPGATTEWTYTYTYYDLP